ncbi:Fanconi anemia core complex-associated protein 24-like [Ruditapes philippinarum]|uniref:Fanconi anemia core complex-associated protein 24-like n=1 Tax=Ruditapes philippinarum TaxID=129788 RepID=UPI00295C1DA7|nr:Fanconi anemia core complex-associated protein 24-like [Ruditapes philippinarum]
MAGNLNVFSCTQTPERACMRVPFGHVLINSKWQNSELVSAIQGVNVVFEDNLGYIDFHPATHIGVVYATEADLVSQASVRRKLAKLRKANKVQVLVLAEKTGSSSQYYQSLQKFVVMELGFIITPVPTQTEAAGLIAQMVHTENKLESNPFCKKRKHKNLDECLLGTVQCIPKLGGVKARKLLEAFKSLEAINAASVDELTGIVGKSSAQNIRNFFDSKHGT